jgi:hypothetical protein
MKVILYLVIFTVASLLVLHFALKKYYGLSSLIWSWVEYVWCTLSFIALFLANIQIKDKTESIQIDLYREEVQRLWKDIVKTGDAI